MIDTFADNKTIAGLEGTHMTAVRRSTYTACEDHDFHWDVKEVKEFRKLWKQGLHIADIAEVFNRPPAEVMFLAYDQAECGWIEPRSGAIFGSLGRGID